MLHLQQFIEKNKCLVCNGRVENGLMYLYEDSWFNVTNVSTMYTKYESWNILAFNICTIHTFAKPRTRIQIITRMNKVVIGHYYHVIILNENKKWIKLAHLLPSFPLDFRTPFCTSTFTSQSLYVHTKTNKHTNKTPLSCILCKLIPRSEPLFTLTLVCTWYESTPWARTKSLTHPRCSPY